MKPLQLSLCAECGTLGVDDLRKALGDLTGEVVVTQSACLGPCDQPSVLAIQTRGHAGYVFAGVTQNDANDIAATCALILASDQGWIEDARPCGRLRHLLVARMPA
jgi:predicted metal-binding protein